MAAWEGKALVEHKEKWWAAHESLGGKDSWAGKLPTVVREPSGKFQPQIRQTRDPPQPSQAAPTHKSWQWSAAPPCFGSLAGQIGYERHLRSILGKEKDLEI